MLKTTQFKKGTVTFSDTGKGRAVVLLHGFLGSHKIWNSTIESLSKSFRVIAIDLPGHGDTDCFGYVHTSELIAKAVKAVMDSLRLKKYVIVGHSMGGYAGLAFADLFLIIYEDYVYTTLLLLLIQKKKNATEHVLLKW
jgi:pimeloyl-ACP methyl ester carboxylesterase